MATDDCLHMAGVDWHWSVQNGTGAGPTRRGRNDATQVSSNKNKKEKQEERRERVGNRPPDTATRHTGKVAAREDARLPCLWLADARSTTRTFHSSDSELITGRIVTCTKVNDKLAVADSQHALEK